MKEWRWIRNKMLQEQGEKVSSYVILIIWIFFLIGELGVKRTTEEYVYKYYETFTTALKS